jgi:DNA-directed RNA polymerase specialized sigma subunit
MEDIKLQSIREALETLEVLKAIAKELSRASTNWETAIVFLEKFSGTIREQNEYFADLYTTLEKSINDFKKVLLNISRTFNDTEQEVFIKQAFEGKTINQIAAEMNYSSIRVKQLSSNIGKRIQKFLEQGGEDNG